MSGLKKNFSADWIWHCGENDEDEYAEFIDSFNFGGEAVKVNISARGDYTLFVNGQYAASGQYGDFEHYKVYDQIDITSFLKEGENKIAILAWYFGKTGMRYFTPDYGIMYEILCDDKVLCASSESTMSRKSKGYLSGRKKKISAQLDYTFLYNACSDDDWITCGGSDFSKSRVVLGTNELYSRPVKKHLQKPIVKGKISKNNKGYLIDFGEELVGLCSFSFTSECEESLNISYGELLEDGHVKQILSTRDFSFDYVSKKGKNVYTNYMFRFACRYMEIKCESEINFDYFGIIPTVYPVSEKAHRPKNELDRQIYEMCLNTLNLCMMEHYVDCPWREQCLYAFDSRNQILGGYTAYEGGNAEYARANLRLISKDSREDNLLSICYPSGVDYVIPSFSLYFVLAVKEYVQYSGDLEFAKEVFEKIESVLSVFCANIEDGTVSSFEGKNYWNFYDWSEYCDGYGKFNKKEFILNAATVIAINSFDFICEKLRRENKFKEACAEIIKNAREMFYSKEKGTFFLANESENATEIVNSLAILSGIATEEQTENICRKLASGELVDCSLSMKVFKYDALLSFDREKYADYVINDIRRIYEPMVNSDSTTVWEVAEGAAAFENAGSLCHGWSAAVIHYYDILNML